MLTDYKKNTLKIICIWKRPKRFVLSNCILVLFDSDMTGSFKKLVFLGRDGKQLLDSSINEFHFEWVI